MCPNQRLLAWKNCRWANQKWSSQSDWLGWHIWLSVVGLKLEAGTKIREAVNSWPFGADGYWSYCLASWVVSRDSILASSKYDYSRLASQVVYYRQGVVSWVGFWVKVQIFLNWNLVDIQYYVSFRGTTQWFDICIPNEIQSSITNMVQPLFICILSLSPFTVKKQQKKTKNQSKYSKNLSSQ